MPLFVNELKTSDMRSLLLQDPEIITWWGTHTECISALNKKVREGVIEPLGLAWSYVLLYQLRNSWSEVQPVEEVRELADRLLERHPLRAADALQLGASLVWCGQRPQGRELVTLDKNLWSAADAEGFSALPAAYV